jgi:RND family efflux transporter MFP subunit
MTSGKFWFPVAVLLLSAAAAFVLVATAPEVESVAVEEVIPVVRTIVVTPSDIRMDVRSQGTVAPRTESELVPEVSGPLVWVSPSLVSGGFFKKGEPLLRIDPRDYKTSVARARADLARAEGEAEHAAAELERHEALARSSVNSPSQLSNARRARRVADAALDSARVSLDQARRDLGRAEILAPFDGRVREEHLDVGQFVSRGVAIATLYSTDFAEIRLPLADRQLAFLDVPSVRGSDLADIPVRLYAKFAGTEQIWHGRIVRTEGEIDAKSRMVHVIARVEDPYHLGANKEQRPPLAVGMFVRAEIQGRIAANVVAVPRAAIRDADNLLIVDAQNELHRRSVEVLRIDRDEVLVRAPLAAEDRVVVSPIQVIVEGMRVQPVADQEPADS